MNWLIWKTGKVLSMGGFVIAAPWLLISIWGEEIAEFGRFRRQKQLGQVDQD